MTTSKMIPSRDLLITAKNKLANLTPNTQIRLGGSEFQNSYWIFNLGGLGYIGTSSVEREQLPRFFKNRPEYIMTNGNGETIGKLQRLI